MAQATNVNERPVTLAAPPVMAILAVLFMATIVVAALFLPSLSINDPVQPRSEAVLESGRAWQRQYESMSGLEARRERYDEAVLQSGREWEQQQKQISGN